MDSAASASRPVRHFAYPRAWGWVLGFMHALLSYGLLWAWMFLPSTQAAIPLYPLSLIAFSFLWLPGVLLLRQPRWTRTVPQRDLVPEILQWVFIATHLLGAIVSLESWLAWLGIPAFLFWASGMWLMPRHFFWTRGQGSILAKGGRDG